MQHHLRYSHIVGLHLYLVVCFPLRDIVTLCSLLHDLHVLMVLKPSLNLCTTYLDRMAKGGQRVYLQEFWILHFVKHQSFGEIKDNGGHREDCGKIGKRR